MSVPQLSVLIESFLLSREAECVSPRTTQYYEQQLRYFSKWLNNPQATLEVLDADVITSYLAQRRKEVSPHSAHAAWRAVRAFCNWCALRGERFPQWKNPVGQIKGPRLPHNQLPPISREDLDALLRTCAGHDFYDDRDRAILLVLATSGLRISEFLALVIEDVNLKSGQVLVKHGKGDKSRITFISPAARAAVAEYLSHLDQKDPEQPLWWGRKGRLSPTGMDMMLRRRATQAGVKVPSPHDFRRRWASDLVPRIGPFAVQLLGGWAGLQIVQRYVTLTPEDLAEAYKKAGL